MSSIILSNSRVMLLSFLTSSQTLERREQTETIHSNRTNLQVLRKRTLDLYMEQELSLQVLSLRALAKVQARCCQVEIRDRLR